MARTRRRDGTVVHTVTTAGQSREEFLAERQRRYLITMSVRVVLFVAAGVAPVPMQWKLLFCVGALTLPWLAVIAANAQRPPVKRGAPTFVAPGPDDPRALGPGNSGK